MLKKVDISLIGEMMRKGRESSRKRFLYCMHEPEDRLQRQINAGLADTYVTPHKHENPDKLEIFCILRGKVAVLTFDDSGNIKEQVILDEEGDDKIVEIPARTWHSFVILSKEAAVYELLDEYYDARTHKKFAPWAPREEEKVKAMEYLKELKSKIKCN